MDGMDELVGEFLVESHENLDALDRHLVELEEQPTNQELLASIFRTIHTIKGTCGFLGFNRLESVTHVGENLLSRLRDGDIRLNPEVTDLFAFRFQDFNLEGYDPHPHIAAPVAV